MSNKPNNCNKCNKSFCSVKSLANHNKNYHTNIIHKCNFCNIKEYKIYVSFKKH